MFPKAGGFVDRAGTLAKGYPTTIQAVLKGRTVAIRKGNKHQLGLFFLLEACQRNAAGWSMAGWPANAKLPLPHRDSSITRPCCSSAQAPRSLSFTRALDRLRTRRRVGSTHRRGNRMHDHSRYQRDIDWRHRRLSLSLYYSQKSLTHNIGSASVLPIIGSASALPIIDLGARGHEKYLSVLRKLYCKQEQLTYVNSTGSYHRQTMASWLHAPLQVMASLPHKC